MPPLLRLEVTYRCLRGIEMDFSSPVDGSPSPFIALVGANGAGKTTVLEGIALSIGSLLRPYSGISLRRDEKIVMDFEGGGRIELPRGPVTGQVSRLSSTLYIRSGYLPRMPSQQQLAPAPQPHLPIELALLATQPEERIAAVHQWWLHQHWEYPKTTNLDRLWKALEPFLGDLVYAGVNPEDHLPQFDARGTKVSFNELSSGERRLVLLFMEIAMQCGEDGLVLFDEPEAHFHPKWQSMLPAALAELLPRGQVIVATHAPHIVEGLPAHQLYVLGELPW